MPASWPVYDLSAHPSVCVRFNRHAVYLGTPSREQRCPAHAVGRTETILVAPVASAARAGATTVAALPAADGRSSAELRLGGVEVTATWGRSAGTVAQVLGAGRLAAARRAAEDAAAASARSAAASAQSNSPSSGPSASAARAGPRAHASTAIATGLGFDPCATPSAATMSAWLASPYRSIGVYVGGADMACSQPNLTAGWVRQQTAAGWHFIPTYVGLQAPTNSCGCASIQAGSAAAEGSAAASDAIARSQAVGFGRGSPIYFDMEAYTRTSSATSAVRSFLAAWTSTLHASGYVSGVYSSASSGIRDLVAANGTGYLEPDDIWIANWNGNQTTSDPYVPSSQWAAHQRLHQYSGGHNATYGGVTLNIDGDYLDGAVAGAAPLFPDGTLLQDQQTLAFYRVAGGAPMYVSDLNTVGGPQAAPVVSDQQLASMNRVPADRTFLVTSAGRAYRVAGGAPIGVSDWSVFGGMKPYVLIDDWDIVNIANPLAHLRVTPANGTMVRGLPSGTYWGFQNGGRYRTSAHSNAINVDDNGLLAFRQVPPPSGGAGLGLRSCVVPALGRKTLSQVKVALGRAHCRLGSVRRPRRVRLYHTLRVVAQSPKAKVLRAANYKVGVTLA
ncbi:MAG: DUF1906 domain-containing protein [Solirubrobacterales bacterium]|nr:DUF1906 domain-containing protein [Solirubrobacterales bacterium]